MSVKKVIHLDPETVQFIQAFATIDEAADTTYSLNINLKHLEMNTFELVPNVQRYFFVTYNGQSTVDNKPVVGHLAFWLDGFPSLLWITEQLIPEKAHNKCCNVLIMFLHEFKNFGEYFAFCEGHEAGGELKGLIGL